MRPPWGRGGERGHADHNQLRSQPASCHSCYECALSAGLHVHIRVPCASQQHATSRIVFCAVARVGQLVATVGNQLGPSADSSHDNKSAKSDSAAWAKVMLPCASQAGCQACSCGAGAVAEH